MLTRLIRIQLLVFTALTLIAVMALTWYLRVPSLAGVGQYTLAVELPTSGGLYRTSNVTYDGLTVGKVTDVQPTPNGVRATLSMDSQYRIPADVSADVHSLSAVGEQYVDLVSANESGPYLSDGQVITKSTVPSPVGPILDATQRSLAAIPQGKLSSLLDESSRAVGGLGPVLHRLTNSTQQIVTDFNRQLGDIDDLIDNSAPIIDSQVVSRDNIQHWTANFDTLATQAADHDDALRSSLSLAAPTADGFAALLNSTRETLPQVAGNLAIVLDMLKRYHAGVEQLLVILPQGGSIAQTVTNTHPEGGGGLDVNFAFNQPPPCLTGFLPASQWRSPADTTPAPPRTDIPYCKIPKDSQTSVRGARNFPCVDVPGKRAATPQECRTDQPYTPDGTNPWYGEPNQVRNCPAPGARCDQPVVPGRVIPAPTVDNGQNPIPADQLPPPTPIAPDPLTPQHSGTVDCDRQQPNQCTYTKAPGTSVLYDVRSSQVTGPGSISYQVHNSGNPDKDAWKAMLGPVR